MMEEETSDEEKQAIIVQLLTSSPPGEISHVLADLKTICSDDLLTQQVLTKAFHIFNVDNLQVMTTEEGDEHVIVSNKTEITPNEYMLPVNRIATVNHIKQTIQATTEGHQVCETSLEEQRVAVDEHLAQYVKSQYVDNTATRSVCLRESTLIILLSAEKLNLRNFWGGRWMSSFEYDFEKSTFSGKVKIRVHYFEDGNVQMKTEKCIEEEFLECPSTSEEFGVMLVNRISKHESAIQSSLEEMYLNMSKETFKDMRRILPISKQRMDWSGAQMALAQGFSSK